MKNMFFLNSESKINTKIFEVHIPSANTLVCFVFQMSIMIKGIKNIDINRIYKNDSV